MTSTVPRLVNIEEGTRIGIVVVVVVVRMA